MKLNIKNQYLLTALLVVLSTATNEQLAAQPFVINKHNIAENKKKYTAKNTTIMSAFKKLLKEADKALNTKPFSVTYKPDAAPTTDKHNYVSIAPYWFPDPNTPDGLPYIRKDGQRTPELANYPDKDALTGMANAVDNLALIYYFTDEQKYAEKAITFIRTFFLDENTRMNPNMNYAQIVKGHNGIRGAGLIESRYFIKVIDAIGLLQQSPEWTDSDQKGMEQWFSSFLQWMEQSNNGRAERHAINNHGVFYDAQRISYALFTHNDETVRNVIESFKTRIDVQQAGDGSFPAELERTIGLHYSTFIINAFVSIAAMAEHVDEDLWNYVSENGKSLKTAIDFLFPYATAQKQWKWQQISPYRHITECIDLFKIASLKYHDPRYADGLNRVLSINEISTHRSSIVLNYEL